MSDLELNEALKVGDWAKAEESIKNGADINQQDEQGWTSLNFAAGKGDISLVKFLVELGADVFKVGRDLRTPYMIALAAGHAEVAKFLRQAEDQVPGERPSRHEPKYCKAYRLRDFRQFPGWTESGINQRQTVSNIASGDPEKGDQTLSDDNIVFLHQDYTVTKSMWHDEDLIFDRATPDWKEYCTAVLDFKIPDDLDLSAPSESIS